MFFIVSRPPALGTIEYPRAPGAVGLMDATSKPAVWATTSGIITARKPFFIIDFEASVPKVPKFVTNLPASRPIISMDKESSFQEHRPLLFSLAYRMLGTRSDAED